VDIEFMLIAAQTASLKIYKIKAEINDEETEQFLMKYFPEESRINISQFLKWCESQGDVYQFCQIIKKDLPLYNQPDPISQLFFTHSSQALVRTATY